jgi:hypothetical protein
MKKSIIEPLELSHFENEKSAMNELKKQII